eukprot:1155443-Pelagomonas_calceolata.AAC.8
MGRFTLVAMQVVPQHKTLPPCPCSCLIPDAGLQIMPRSFSPNYRLLAAAAGTRMAKAGVDTWHRCGHMAGYMHMVQVWARGRRWEYDTGVATWQGKRYKCCSTAERHYSWGCQPLMYATSTSILWRCVTAENLEQRAYTLGFSVAPRLAKVFNTLCIMQHAQMAGQVAARLPKDVPFAEVDAHNVVPVWVASDKREVRSAVPPSPSAMLQKCLHKLQQNRSTAQNEAAGLPGQTCIHGISAGHAHAFHQTYLQMSGVTSARPSMHFKGKAFCDLMYDATSTQQPIPSFSRHCCQCVVILYSQTSEGLPVCWHAHDQVQGLLNSIHCLVSCASFLKDRKWTQQTGACKTGPKVHMSLQHHLIYAGTAGSCAHNPPQDMQGSKVLKFLCACPFSIASFTLALQTGARTIRPKVHKNLPEFLREYPALPQAPTAWPSSLSRQPDNGPSSSLDWDALIAEALQRCVGKGAGFCGATGN